MNGIYWAVPLPVRKRPYYSINEDSMTFRRPRFFIGVNFERLLGCSGFRVTLRMGVQ